MTEQQGQAPVPRRQLERPQDDRILGGVCAAIARYSGVDPVVVRLATAALAILSAGVVLLAYLTAWVLIPPAGAARPPASTAEEPTTARAAATGAREAWNTLGDDLRSLADDLRPRGTGEQTPAAGASPPSGAATGGGRGPVGSVDATLTALGGRVRDPKVRADARRAAGSLSTAVTASVDEIGRRGRRAGDGP
jgi:phage shock protein C